jgi:ribonuclease HII
MTFDMWAFENALSREGYRRIAGVDEAGRGPLAGPVVAAAVVLPPRFAAGDVNDSKQLTEKRRNFWYQRIYTESLAVGIGIVDALEIDRINILQASRLAMAMAVANLAPNPDFVLIDGNADLVNTDLDSTGLPPALPRQTLVKGDARSVSIAAASIVAKVTRDSLMKRYHMDYPLFGFDRHKGYPTAAHRAALADFGPCPIHRCSFRGVREHITPRMPFAAHLNHPGWDPAGTGLLKDYRLKDNR